MLIAAVAGLIVVLQFFLSPIDILDFAKAEVVTWSSICAAFGILAGAFGLLYLHVSRIRKAKDTTTKTLSWLTLAVAALFLIVGASFEGLTASVEYVLIYQHILGALASSVRAVAFFSCLIGAYRAFRVDNIDSLVMFVSASVYLVRGFAAGVYIFPIVLPIGEWLASVPGLAATRGAIIAAAVSALILAVRVFTGKERSVAEAVFEAEKVD